MKTQVLKKIRHSGGFAYVAPTQRFGLSSAILLENDVPLPGPANASQDSIRILGNGRYSFWFAEVAFSSSDNSDPRNNGRLYSFRYVENELTRLGILLLPFHWVLKLLPNSVLPTLKNSFMGVGHSLESLRRLKFSFPFWSLFYWISFFYVTSLRRNDQN